MRTLSSFNIFISAHKEPKHVDRVKEDWIEAAKRALIHI